MYAYIVWVLKTEKINFIWIYYEICGCKFTKEQQYITEIKENLNFFHKVIIFNCTNICLYFYSILLCTVKYHFMVIESSKNLISFHFMVNAVVCQIILGNCAFCTKISKKIWLLNICGINQSRNCKYNPSKLMSI